MFKQNIDPEVARWWGRAATYDDGLHYPGGPDEQPAKLMRIVDIIADERAGVVTEVAGADAAKARMERIKQMAKERGLA